MKKLLIVVLTLALIMSLSGCFATHYIGNQIDFVHHKIDEATDYETIKSVEDTCRAMMTSYEADKLTYEQYKDSDNETKQEWAEQAKMRANKTASEYNNYILKNSFVWGNNVPLDIRSGLDYLN